jgi:hypothetical protein
MSRNARPLALLAAVFAFAAFGLVGPAHADPGSICKNFNAWDVGFIDYLPTAVRSLRNEPTTVLCPVGAIPDSESAFVEVGVLHNSTQTTRCTAYTFDPQGRILSSGTHGATFAGFLTLAPQIRTRIRGSVGMLCTIPGAGNGLLTDVNAARFGAAAR